MLGTNKLDAAQLQATESNLILQLTKKRLDFLALAQCMFESGSVGTITPSEPGYVYSSADGESTAPFCRAHCMKPSGAASTPAMLAVLMLRICFH